MSDDPHVREFLQRMAGEIDAAPLDPHSPVKRARRRRSVMVAIVAVVVVAMVAGGSVGLRSLREIRPRPAVKPTEGPVVPVYRLVDVSDGSAAPFAAPDGGSWFRFSLDGSEVIFVNDDADGHHQLFRMNPDGSQVTQITPDSEWASQADEPAWSADGKWIAYSGVTPSGHPQIIAARPSGYHPPRAQLSWKVTDARAPSWSPDGSELAFAANGIWVLRLQYYSGGGSIEGLSPRRILRAGTSPAWSPSGHLIAFTSGRGSGRRVAIGNEDGTHVREITVSTSDRPAWSPDGRVIAYNVWNSDGDVAVWLYDLGTGHHKLLMNGVLVESWKDDGTLLVSMNQGG